MDPYRLPAAKLASDRAHRSDLHAWLASMLFSVGGLLVMASVLFGDSLELALGGLALALGMEARCVRHPPP